MPSVQRQSTPKIEREIFWNDRATIQQIPYPQPRKTPECHLEAACPVDSDSIWILLMPVIPLPEQLLRIARVSGQAISLGKSDQVLVTTELPSDLCVSHAVKV